MGVEFTDEDLIDHDAVGAVIRDAAQRVLVLQHSKWGFWSIPIGKAHKGQKPFEGLREEMRDELGIEVIRASEMTSATIRYTEGRDVLLRFHIYEIDEYDGRVENREPEKHGEFRFLPMHELAAVDKLSDATVLFLEAQGLHPRAPWTGIVVDGL
jgi:8-oxo-dGTP pyrophosphatase MutT (NUDIX family)